MSLVLCPYFKILLVATILIFDCPNLITWTMNVLQILMISYTADCKKRADSHAEETFKGIFKLMR